MPLRGTGGVPCLEEQNWTPAMNIACEGPKKLLGWSERPRYFQHKECPDKPISPPILWKNKLGIQPETIFFRFV